MSSLMFLKNFLMHPIATGAVAASSGVLARTIVEAADIGEARVVVEFGPGTGVFTEEILRALSPGALFFTIEQNPEFAEATRRRCPDAIVYSDSALNTQQHLREHGAASCDRIVCGLPWASFPESLQDSLLAVVHDVLAPGGRFVTFAYLQGLLLPAGLRFARKLRRSFHRVTTTPTVWRNLPPAFVYCADTRP